VVRGSEDGVQLGSDPRVALEVNRIAILSGAGPVAGVAPNATCKVRREVRDDVVARELS